MKPKAIYQQHFVAILKPFRLNQLITLQLCHYTKAAEFPANNEITDEETKVDKVS